jgi:hypothetical protein
MERAELSAPMTVVAILLVGVLAKLGYGWCGIAVMVALCLLGTVRKPNPTREGPLRGVSAPLLG